MTEKVSLSTDEPTMSTRIATPPLTATLTRPGLGLADYVVAGGFLVLLSLLAYPLRDAFARYWFHNESYTHAPLLPLIAGYFIWAGRKELLVLPVERSGRGLAFLVLAAMLFLLGLVGAERFTLQTALVSLLVGLVWANFGNAIARHLIFPFVLLYLAVPIPSMIYNNLSFDLQILSSKLSVGFMQLFALPVYREGNVINLSYTQLEVAEACSGITSLLSLITVAVIFAYVAQKRFLPRAILVVSAVPIAVLTNAFRIGGTGMLAHFWSVKVAQGFFHSFSGWLVFVAAFLILIFENSLIVLAVGRDRKPA